MNLDDALQTFVAESRGLLADMEDALLRLESAHDDVDAINAVFRAAHTIKGSAGLFALDHIVAFAHRAESVLDRVREGALIFDEALSGLMLECKDFMEQQIEHLASTAAPDAAHLARGEALSGRLQGYMAVSSIGAVAPAPEVPLHKAGGGPVDADAWHLSLRFGAEVLQHGLDPLSFIRYLRTVGEIRHITTLADRLPAADDMDPERCYLGFEISLVSAADKARIEGVFDFVREDCELRILAPGSKTADFAALMEQLPEGQARIGEILVGCGALTPRELEEILALQAHGAVADTVARPLGQMLVKAHVVQPEVVDAALKRQKDVRTRQAQEAKLVRVHADKLDALINRVGELVIAGAGVGLLANRHRDRALVEAASAMARLVEDIRDGAMRLRMVDIGDTFNRFKRVVRDMSKELGKDIELVIAGADTELDKTVVEKIADPLTHLVRNAMDHGIESRAVREAAGKPAHGTVRLNAYHESGGIVIEVADDGGGLHRERILAKARERGLIEGGDHLPDSEVWNLIFEPGFSTAEQVSNLSGRGVGMDVVRRNIEALRGSVEIDSRAGEGSVFRIRLPLTLAIIDGFLMRVGEGYYVVPLDIVIECVELGAGGASTEAACDYLDLRGEALPLLRLRDHLGLGGAPGRRQNVVVIHGAGRKAGLVVDELKGELQAVIKPLGQMFASLRGIAGSTILGSGEVGLVLDVPTLLDAAISTSARRPMPALA